MTKISKLSINKIQLAAPTSAWLHFAKMNPHLKETLKGIKDILEGNETVTSEVVEQYRQLSVFALLKRNGKFNP